MGGALIAGLRAARGTSLGGYLIGAGLPLLWVGYRVGDADRVCTEAWFDLDDVEHCTAWEPTGSIRWPWFLAAGIVMVLGALLAVAARRRENRGWRDALASRT